MPTTYFSIIMPVKKEIDFNSLKPWVADFLHPPPPGRGPMEHVFVQMFSMEEKFAALMLGAAPMGEDPHNDARQSILCLAKMLDRGETTRAVINVNDQTQGMVVDVVSLKGTQVWTLGDEANEPIIFLRYAYHTMDFEDPINNPVDGFKVAQSLGKSMPPKGGITINCASKEEMKILKTFFEENAAKLSPSLREMIEACADKKLLRIPLSYTSFLCPLPKPEPKKESQFCLVCGSVASKVCVRCKVARYCSKECQVQDWRKGHKKKCKTPEAVALDEAAASGSEEKNSKEKPWVDIDPKKTPEEAAYFTAISARSAISSLPGMRRNQPFKKTADMLKGIKTDKVMIVKVQISPGSHPSDATPICVYPQGKKFQLCGLPQNIVSHNSDYCRLHQLVQSEGYDPGLGVGGCKIYLDAYVTSNGLLRIMLNDIKPLQKW